MSNMRILVVDDDIQNSQALERHLKDFGHSVSLAANRNEGITVSEQEAFDLILTDLCMPKSAESGKEMHSTAGLDVIGEVIIRNPKRRIWLMSAELDDRIAVTAVRLGAEKAVPKSKLLETFKLEEITR